MTDGYFRKVYAEYLGGLETVVRGKDQTLSGAGEVASGVFSMRLVSLWWELPPRLDSNNSIWNSGLQQKSVFSSYLFFTSTPAISSKTLIVEQISSSPCPVAMAAWNICWVNPVNGRGTQLVGRVEHQADVLVHPLHAEVGCEVAAEYVRRFERDQSRLGGAVVQDFQHQLGIDARLCANTMPSLNACKMLERIRFWVSFACRPMPGPPQ